MRRLIIAALVIAIIVLAVGARTVGLGLLAVVTGLGDFWGWLFG